MKEIQVLGKWMLLVAASVGITGCGRFDHQLMMMPGAQSVSGHKVEVGSISNPSGTEASFDYVTHFKTRLKDAILDSNLELGDGAEAVRIDSRIISYEMGNAFKRWLWPGFGRTKLHITSKILDNQTNQKIGQIEIHREVSFGGVFSVGAYKHVFDDASQKIVEHLEEIL